MPSSKLDKIRAQSASFFYGIVTAALLNNSALQASPQTNPQNFQTFLSSLVEADESLTISKIEQTASQESYRYAKQHYSLNTSTSLSKPDVENYPDRSRPRWSAQTSAALPYGLSLEYDYSRNLSQVSTEQEQSIGVNLNLWPNLLGRKDRSSESNTKYKTESKLLSHKNNYLEVCKAARLTYVNFLSTLIKKKFSETKTSQSKKVLSQLQKRYKQKQIREIDFRGAEIDYANTQSLRNNAYRRLQDHFNSLRSRPRAFASAKTLEKQFYALKPIARLDYFLNALNSTIASDPTPNSYKPQEHPSTQSQVANQLAALEDYKIKKSTLQPTVDFRYTYSEGDVSSLTPQQKSYGIALSWDLWSPTQKSQLAQSRAQSLIANARKVIVTRQLEEDFRSALNQMESSKKNLTLFLAQRSSSKRQLFLASEDLRYGRMGIESYLNYRNAYWSIEEKIVEAQTKLYSSQSELLFLRGDSKALCGITEAEAL